MKRTMKTQRLLMAGMAALLAVGISACGGDVIGERGPTSPAPAPAAPGNPDGVTTAAQVFGPACAQLPQGGTPGSAARVAGLGMSEAIAASPLLRTMTNALNQSGLAGQVNSEPGVTVFAPYDRGFTNLQQNLGQQRYDALFADKAKLTDAVKYLVVVKRYDRAGLAGAKNVTTLQGGSLKITDAGDTMNITDNAGTTAHVLCGNIPTRNGTLFLIDNVLQPRQP